MFEIVLTDADKRAIRAGLFSYFQEVNNALAADPENEFLQMLKKDCLVAFPKIGLFLV